MTFLSYLTILKTGEYHNKYCSYNETIHFQTILERSVPLVSEIIRNECTFSFHKMVQRIVLDSSEVRFDVLCKCNYFLINNNLVRQYKFQKIIEARKNANPCFKKPCDAKKISSTFYKFLRSMTSHNDIELFANVVLAIQIT